MQKEKEDVLESARTFGTRVRMLREEKGLSLNKVASSAKVSPSTVSRIERGHIAPSRENVALLAEALALGSSEVQELFALVSAHGYERSLPSSVERLAAPQELIRLREAQAETIKGFSFSLIPGLLQTEKYMEAVFTKCDSRKEVVSAAIKARLRRQEILCRTKEIQLILSEYALSARLTSREDHLTQLDHLIHVSQAGKITLGLLPLQIEIPFLIPCSFHLFGEVLGACDTFDRDMLLWDSARINEAEFVFEEIKKLSLFGARFREKVLRVKDRLESLPPQTEE